MNQHRVFLSRPLPALTLVLLGVGLDQISKYCVELFLPYETAIPVLPFFALYRTFNEGIAFSMLAGQSGFFIVAMRLVIVAAVLWWWRRSLTAGILLHCGFALIVAGAIGNLIDRFLYGHVIDFILLHTENWSFAVFNLADSFITIGACLVGLHELFFAKDQPKSAD